MIQYILENEDCIVGSHGRSRCEILTTSCTLNRKCGRE